MSTFIMNRRSALALLGAAVLGPGCATTSAGPSPFRRFRAVQVDVRPLAATGDTYSADVLAQTMPPWIQRYFGPYIAPGDKSAPLLILRVQSLTFGLPGSANGPNGNGAMDYSVGEGVVIGNGGREVATYPLTCALFTAVDLNDITDNYTRHRVESLGQALAQFLPGKMGL
jgi:hypothetical protein